MADLTFIWFSIKLFAFWFTARKDPMFQIGVLMLQRIYQNSSRIGRTWWLFAIVWQIGTSFELQLFGYSWIWKKEGSHEPHPHTKSR
jgi:hypothetical protein